MDTKNVVMLTGRLVADPELRITPGGDPVVTFGLAVNRSIKKPDGSWEDKLDGFFDCEHFGETAVKFAEDYGKGDMIQVTRSLQQRKFKVANGDGSRTVSKIEVRAKTLAAVLVAPKAKLQDAAPSPDQPTVSEQQSVPEPAGV